MIVNDITSGNHLNKKQLHMKWVHFILVFLLLFNFLVHIPFLSMPAVDTETSYYYASIAIVKNHFNIFTPTFEEKPPLVFILPSISFNIYPNIIWGRLQSLVAATIALYYVFFLTKLLYSSSAGLFAVLLCMFFPMFTFQSIFFTDYMPQTAVFIATLYYFISKQKTGYFISACLAVLTKEPMVFIPLLLYVFSLVSIALKNHAIKRKDLSENDYLLYPLCVFVIWMFLNKFFFGYFLYPGNRINIVNGLNFSGVFGNIRQYIIRFIQLANGTVIYYMGAFLYIDYFRKSTKQTYKKIETICLLLFVLGIYLAFYGRFFSWSMPYILFLYPLVFILFAGILREYFSKKLCGIIIIYICFLFVYSQWQITTDTSLSVMGPAQDIRAIAQQQYIRKIVQQIQMHANDTVVFADYQIAHSLWNPLFGYVSSPGDNVFQIANPNTNAKDCPTCKCRLCKYQYEIPHQKKVLIVWRKAWISEIEDLVSSYGKILTTIEPDWPKNSIDKFTIYEYYNPNP